MGNVGEGAKAGLLAGILYGILESILGILILLIFKNHVISVLKSSLPSNSVLNPTELYNFTLELAVVAIMIGGIIIGLILGLIFGAAYSHLPGSSGTAKGLFFGLIMWLLFSVLLGLGDLRYGVLYYGLGLGAGLITSLIFGGVMGKLFDRGMRKLSRTQTNVVG